VRSGCTCPHNPRHSHHLIRNLAPASISLATISTPRRTPMVALTVTTRPSILRRISSHTLLSSSLAADLFSLGFSPAVITILPVSRDADPESPTGLRNAASVMNSSKRLNLSPAPSSPTFSRRGATPCGANCAPTPAGILALRSPPWPKPSRIHFLTSTCCSRIQIRSQAPQMPERVALTHRPGGSASPTSQRWLTFASYTLNGDSRTSS
jgi:hypothetical protein